MEIIFVVLCCVGTLWSIAGMICLWRLTPSREQRRGSTVRPTRGTWAPVSVLKPLCGIDDQLADNLRSFFRLRHPQFELVFGVEGQNDPAIQVVEALRRHHPHVPCRLVVHDGGRGINPKVASLREMMKAASHDVVVISDSNVRVPRDYLSRMIGELQQEGVGLVTSLFVGQGERTLGAALESSQLNGPMAVGVAATHLMVGHPISLGKSMALRHSDLARLGGLESVASVLAEDYIIGRMFASAGYKVRISTLPVDNICRYTTVAGLFKRLLRWNMIRFRMVPLPFALEPLTIPLSVALGAPMFGVPLVWALLWAATLTILRDGLAWWRLRGTEGIWRVPLLFIPRDLIFALSHMLTPLFRHVRWRGRRVLVSTGTRLYAEPAGHLQGTAPSRESS